ncbi:hypothetical protein K3722_03110 [Leisingera caerulea]|uniref:Peptide methionine sulfoxide reductase n=1 Tax=Leisingera caerulea TaxID=506591 RepID=A0ABY5WY22_LEICA|nr:hypothetical protein [Leisingera caerulea]UWQ50455.1 hypothetical protein K3720_03330 [Leisingera caerulea]UWQ59139.1 hypothetical protein K3722_03110 [Leisingera caerulea]UWQ84184.1 hypothetical protein K3726_03000 [Leisingera caerulea]
MTGTELQAFLAAFDALPAGAFTGLANGRKYAVIRQDLAAGKAQKLVAHELGGSDYISLNLYRLASGARLKPCEMPAEAVIRFVLDLKVME